MTVNPGTRVIACAPGRVNLIGEHTDYNGGFVLPMAIHLGVTAEVTMRDDDRLVISSRQVPGATWELTAIDELVPSACDGWVAYIAGVVWALSRHAAGAGLEVPGEARGLSIVVSGDVPLGAGLSSSAALECSVAMALNHLWQLDLPRRTLATVAQTAENDFVGVPTGSMDQVASMLGREGSALFFDVLADDVAEVPLRLDDAGLALLVIDTRAAHALVDGGYAARRQDCERAAEILGVGFLREAESCEVALPALAAAGAGAVLIRRARHVITENQRVVDGVEALQRNDFSAFGRLMVESHASLRDDFEVSCPELDCAVEGALTAGALGARMTGGGFGGSAIALVPRSVVDDVCATVSADFTANGFGEPHFLLVRPSAGARVM